MPDIAPNAPEVRSPARLIVHSHIDRQTEHNIHVYSMQPREAVNGHIQDLKKEWSIERIIEAGASVLSIIGLLLGAFVSPWCLILPALISALFLAHAILHFSPALPLLQEKGTRTTRDIDAETFAMKSLRSDDASSEKDKAALAERVIGATQAYSSID